MDLKFKGVAWVGNIYHKFEAICHEVDDFMSQETVKNTENKAQTVGDSVEILCTDAVQDLLPCSLVESGKREAEAVSLKQNDAIGIYVRSDIIIEEKPVLIDSYLSYVEQYPIDPLHSHEQCVYPPSANHVKEAESDLSLGREVNPLEYKKSDIILKENGKREKVMYKESDIVYENDKNEKQLDKRSDIVGGENDTKEEASQPEELELIYPENKDVSESSLLSESINEKNGILAEVRPVTLECLTQIDKIACISFSDEVECALPPSVDLSVVSGENMTTEVELISSRTSLFTGSMSDFSHENVSEYEESNRYNPVDAIGCVSDLSDSFSSSQPLPMLSCDDEVADKGLIFSSRSAISLESNGVDTSTTHDAASLAGSSGTRSEYFSECTRLKFSVPPWVIGEGDEFRVDIADPSMESIELSDDDKLNEGCIAIENKLFHAFSSRSQRHRSYKEILQDAFASKRRIRKEYEQLAILYGDIDIESSQQPGRNLLLPSSSLDSKKSSSQDSCEPEWELL